MKNNFKKVISLVLTVLMVLGTMSAILPFAVSAEEVTYPYTLKKNETAVAPNGVTYRFDVADGHTNSWAKLNADGSWEVNISNGDMLWFPDVEMTDSSEIYAEVTSMSTVNHFPGLAYGVESTTDSAYTGTNVAVIRTNSGKVRLRATGATRDALNNDKGGVTVNNFEVAINDAWTSIANPANGNWDAGKTIYHKIYQTDDKVVTEFGAPGMGAFGNPESQTSYEKGMAGMYAFDGGSVGYTMVWAEGKNYEFRIDALTITNCEVAGEAKDSYSLIVTENGGSDDPGETPVVPPVTPGDPVYLEKNKTATYNGITYRFDTNKADDADSWVRVNADGSWEISIRNGDMLWFPDVELTGTSEIYAEVTNTMNEPNNYFTGFAYGVTSSTDSTWTNTNVAILKTYQNSKARFRAANAERSSLIKVSGSDYGNGGDTRAFDSSFTSDVWNSAAAGANGNWGPGKTVYYKMSQSGSDVVLEYGAPGVGAFVDATNTTYTASKLNAVAGGSVGYTHVWQSNDTAHVQLRIEDITITNCKVGGVDKATYSVNANNYDVAEEKISLSLNGTIGLNFSFNAGTLLPTGATVVATMNGKVVAEQAVVNGENLMSVPVAAKEMGDEVKFAIMNGEEVVVPYEPVSVKQYAEALMADDSFNEWDELMDSMLNYGAAAQKLLDYKTDALVADISGGIDYDFSKVEAITFEGDRDILSGLYMTLSLEADTVMKLYFKPADGVTLEVTINAEAVELVDNGDGYYVATIEGVAADKLAEDVFVTVNDELTFYVNALDWAKIASADADADVATLAKALAVYANEATSKN